MKSTLGCERSQESPVPRLPRNIKDRLDLHLTVLQSRPLKPDTTASNFLFEEEKTC